ncbi:MAG: hypothetical protein ACLUNS_08900 [Alistipes shahii]
MTGRAAAAPHDARAGGTLRRGAGRRDCSRRTACRRRRTNASYASDPEASNIVAVTAINREALRLVEEKLGDRARFTTPLLRTPREYCQNRMDVPPGGTSIY